MMSDEQLREQSGSLATYGFLSSGIYLIWSQSGFWSLFMFKSLAFLVFGMFIAAIILGWFFYLLIKVGIKLVHVVGNFLERKGYVSDAPSSTFLRIAFRSAGLFGILSFLISAVIIYQVTKHAYMAIMV